jgi:hypothetical protein
MTHECHKFLDDRRFWEWVHERKLAERIFRPMFKDRETSPQSSAKKRKVVELD